MNKRGPKHGLSVLEQDALLRLQGHKCPCCLKPFTEEKPWVVEHDHALAALHGHPIGRGCKRCVRGLTCVGCNNFITQVERRDGFFERVWNHIHSRRDS